MGDIIDLKREDLERWKFELRGRMGAKSRYSWNVEPKWFGLAGTWGARESVRPTFDWWRKDDAVLVASGKAVPIVPPCLSVR